MNARYKLVLFIIYLTTFSTSHYSNHVALKNMLNKLLEVEQLQHQHHQQQQHQHHHQHHQQHISTKEDNIKMNKSIYRYEIALDQVVTLRWDIIDREQDNDEENDNLSLKFSEAGETESNDYGITEGRIYFEVEADVGTDDVFGVGFSDHGESWNADLFVMWTDYNGVHHFQDAHTDSYGRLLADTQQNYVLEDVQKTGDGSLTIRFYRYYDTCDDDDYVIDSGTTHIIYFMRGGPLHSLDELNLIDEEVTLQRVQLLKSQIPDAPMPSDVREFVVHVDEVPVPLDETTYWCTVKKLPNFVHKHHVIKFEGVISEETEGIVHHLEVFHCQVPVDEHVINYNAPCKSMSERPKGLEPCTKVLGAWAMGAKYMSYPLEAGAPIGGPNMSRYVMIEVHYNNPQHISGLIDNSGIRFYITKNLRKYDAGIMEIGLEYTDKMALPPHLSQWKLHGYCIPECTQVALPQNGIHIFSSQLHTHLTGMKIYTKHFRDGIELPELNRDDHYSPHYQEIRRLHKPVHVLPGGFSISDEMCVNYVHYYPLTDLEVCKSSVTTEALYDFFNLINRKYEDKINIRKENSYNYHTIEWTDEKIKMLRNFYDTAPLSMQCNQSNGLKFPGYWENSKIPDIKFYLSKENSDC